MATLFVIGNGFDLWCGLESTFKAFNNYSYNQEFDEAFEAFETNRTISKLVNEGFGCWDYLIYKDNFETFTNAHLWADFESAIAEFVKEWEPFFAQNNDSLLSISRNDRPAKYTVLDDFFRLEEMHYESQLAEELKTDRGFFNYEKTDEEVTKTITLRGYADRPLPDLEIYEKRFSKFLKLQMDSEYERRASFLWQELSKKCARSNPMLVDSFNYTSPRCLPYLRHINGDLTNPIIGIDSEGISPDSLAFRFTKASRRADLAIDKGPQGKREAMPPFEIDRIVIFGHSLAKADYNYLFPLFDYISLTNPAVLSDLVFAWSYPTDDIGNYSDVLMRGCKNKLRTDVVTLMSAYFEYRGEERVSSRGFDMLTAMGKIHFVQIPTAAELGLEPRKKQWDKTPGNIEARRKQQREEFFWGIKNEAKEK